MRSTILKSFIRSHSYNSHNVFPKGYHSVVHSSAFSGKQSQSVFLAGVLAVTILASQQDFLSYNYQDYVENDDFVSLKDYLLKDAQRVLRYDQVAYPSRKGKGKKIIQPVATFFPENHEDLQKILKLCNRYGMPMVIAEAETDFVQINLSRLGKYATNQTHQII